MLLDAQVLGNLAARWERNAGSSSDSDGHSRGSGGGVKEPYTFMSVVLISLNPCEWLPNPPFEAFREKPFDPGQPHPYALAELAFQQLRLAYSQQQAAVGAPGQATSPPVNQVIVETRACNGPCRRWAGSC
jgi:hypothetical protein